MKYLLLFILSLLLNHNAFCQLSTANTLDDLNKAIKQAPVYDSAKRKKIAELKQALARISTNNANQYFNLCLKLYDQYEIFNYDSAYGYAKKLLATAYKTGNKASVNFAKIKLSFILLSSGMFEETLDSLKDIPVNSLSDSIKAQYYTLMGRFYYDLGDYDNDSYHTPGYVKKGNRFMDSALLLYPTNSFDYSYYKGLEEIKSDNKEKALYDLKSIMSRPNLTYHQLALAASTLSDIYIQNGEIDTAIALLIKAAIADIKSSTKETAAIFNLAELLFKKGDVKNASVYIEQAINNAVFYGARQRKVQVSSVLSLIESEKVNRVESEKRTLLLYSAIVTFLLLIVITLTIIIYRQFNKLKIADRIITAANIRQQEINDKLEEANKIKEEYIGHFFDANAIFFSNIARFKKSIEQKIKDRKLNEIHYLVNNINLKQEKEDHLKDFDKVFLRLFPDFVKVFNSLFHKEDQIKLKEDELLNTDLRIFALIRMGIHDNERIAQILEYSVNTINTYKTKIRNRSIVPNEEFDRIIMAIKTV